MSDFLQRRESIFDLHLGEKHPNINFSFVRRRVYQNLNFAFRCFWNQENNFYPAANKAIINTLGFFLNKDHTAIFANHDEWYWGFDQLCSLVEWFGSDGKQTPRLLTTETETLFYKFIWLHMQNVLTVKKKVSPDFSKYNTWHIWGSENHHFQLVYAIWHSLRFLARHPNYSGKRMSDGLLPRDHLARWNRYLEQYLLERGKKGLFIEVGFYTPVTLKGIYNLYSFHESALIRRRARAVLDLFWAEWAQEQIQGIRCGPQNRIYLNVALAPSGDPLRGNVEQMLGWLYFGIGQAPTAFNPVSLAMVTSNYTPPPVVEQLALKKRNEPYEIYNRRLGLATDGGYRPGTTYKFRQNNGPLRYAYVTPDYILGSWYRNNWSFKEWTMIGSQNHWFGATFTSDVRARLLFVVNHRMSVYNAFRSVQKKGAILVQQLPYNTHCRVESSHDQEPPSLWVSQLGMQLAEAVKDDGTTPSAFEYRQRGWIFGRAGQAAYFALCVPNALTRWSALNERRVASTGQVVHSGRFLELQAQGQRSPICLEIGRKADWASFEAFRSAVLANQPVRSTDQWTYRSLQGHTLMLPDNLNHFSEIDGQKVTTKPYSARGGWAGMSSPFLQSRFDSGVARVTVDGVSQVIDFN